MVGIETMPLTFDPRLTSDAYSSKISQLLHRGLFRYSERLEIVPDLVARYKVESDLKYHFWLKDGIRFHNGRSFTAEDVKFTLESTRDPALNSPFQSTFNNIEVIEILSPLELVITLKEPFSPILAALTIGILPTQGDPQIGTGPYRLSEVRPNEEIHLVRYSGDGTPGPGIENVLFRVVPDDNLRLLELKNGRIDVLQNNVPPPLLPAVKDDPNLFLATTEGINMTYLGLQLRSRNGNPLQNLRVRQAIAYAIDRKSLMEHRLGGLAAPATGILAPVHWAYEADVPQYGYDPKKAKSLLDEAGFPDPDGDGPAPRFTVTYKTSTKKDRIALARLMARYLKDIGIAVQVLPYEWGIFFHDVNAGNFDIFSLTWVGVSEPDIFYNVFHSAQTPPAGANRGAYQDATVDRLTEEGRGVSDIARRRAIYSEVQKILARDLPIIPLWYETNYAVVSKRVQGLRLRPNASFEWIAEVSKK